MHLAPRAAGEKDFEQIYAIYMNEFALPYLGIDPMSKDEFAPIFSELTQDGNLLAFESNRTIVGFVKITRLTGRNRHVAHIGPLAIGASLQGSGVAASMLTMVLEELANAHVRRVQLIVETDNPRAVRFYLRMGFQIEGVLRGFYRRSHEVHDIDSYMMSRLYA